MSAPLDAPNLPFTPRLETTMTDPREEACDSCGEVFDGEWIDRYLSDYEAPGEDHEVFRVCDNCRNKKSPDRILLDCGRYPDTERGARNLLMDQYGDREWADAVNLTRDPQFAGCWATTPDEAGEFYLVYVGDHPAAPDAEVVWASPDELHTLQSR